MRRPGAGGHAAVVDPHADPASWAIRLNGGTALTALLAQGPGAPGHLQRQNTGAGPPISAPAGARCRADGLGRPGRRTSLATAYRRLCCVACQRPTMLRRRVATSDRDGAPARRSPRRGLPPGRRATPGQPAARQSEGESVDDGSIDGTENMPGEHVQREFGERPARRADRQRRAGAQQHGRSASRVGQGRRPDVVPGRHRRAAALGQVARHAHRNSLLWVIGHRCPTPRRLSGCVAGHTIIKFGWGAASCVRVWQYRSPPWTGLVLARERPTTCKLRG